MVVHTCHPKYTGSINRRIREVQVGPVINKKLYSKKIAKALGVSCSLLKS
jgi:hypothetical protein